MARASDDDTDTKSKSAAKDTKLNPATARAAHRTTNRDVVSETRDEHPEDPHSTRARHPDRVNPDPNTDSTGFELDMRSLAGRYPDGGEEFDINKDDLIRHHLRNGANREFVRKMSGEAESTAIDAGPAIPPGGLAADANAENPTENNPIAAGHTAGKTDVTTQSDAKKT
jgi:hypothetical protein